MIINLLYPSKASFNSDKQNSGIFRIYFLATHISEPAIQFFKTIFTAIQVNIDLFDEGSVIIWRYRLEFKEAYKTNKVS